jgi:AcrR family transcriptional regulator
MPTDATSPWHHGNLLPALIDATDALLVEGGRDAVTLRGVAARVTKGDRTVTHTAALAHVGSLAELLTHVAVRWWVRLLVELDDADRGPPAERLVALGMAQWRFAATHPHPFRLLHDEALWRAARVRPASAAGPRFRQPELLDRLRAGRDALLARHLGAVDDGIADGVLRRDRDPVLMAQVVVTAAFGMAMEELEAPRAEPAVRTMLGLVVDGLRPAARTGDGRR